MAPSAHSTASLLPWQQSQTPAPDHAYWFLYVADTCNGAPLARLSIGQTVTGQFVWYVSRVPPYPVAASYTYSFTDSSISFERAEAAALRALARLLHGEAAR